MQGDRSKVYGGDDGLGYRGMDNLGDACIGLRDALLAKSGNDTGKLGDSYRFAAYS